MRFAIGLLLLGFFVTIGYCDDVCPSFLSNDENAFYQKCPNGTVCFGQCIPGFAGQTSRECLNGVWGPSEGNCYHKRTTVCKAEHYSLALWPKTSAGELAVGTCDPGLNGTATRLCLNNGVWSFALQTHCQMEQCDATIEGDASWPLWNQDALAVTGLCLPGYQGNPIRTCTSANGWGPIQFPCTRTGQCLPGTYARAVWGLANPGKTQLGSCIPGWSGFPQRICGSNGSWSTLVQNHCRRLTCAAATDGITSFPVTNSATNAIGTCSPGYVGHPRRFCNVLGYWEAVIHPCTNLKKQK